MAKITNKLIDQQKPKEKDYIIWDEQLKGFGCKITPIGNKVYLLYYRTKDGRQRKPNIGKHNIINANEARDKAKEWLADVVRGEDPSITKHNIKNPTMKELAEKYMKEHAPTKKPKSRKDDQRLWDMHISPELGDLKVTSVTRKDIRKLHLSLNNKPVCANRVLALLSKAFNLAEEWEYRSQNTNPCKHIKRYKEQGRDRFLSMSEITKLGEVLSECEDEATENPSVINAIKLLLFTGCRLNEILTLKWEYIKIEENTIYLPDSKTGKKKVFLSPSTILLLSEIPREYKNPFVITGKNEGKHLVNLRKAWVRIRKKANLEDVRLHDLRHSFASIAASGGLSLQTIGVLLGHRQVATTARYAHLVDDSLKKAAEQIGNKISLGIK